MICRLLGKKIPTHLLVEWVAIMNEVAEGYTFNWAKMLLDNLAKEIVDYKKAKSKGQFSPFLHVGICYGCHLFHYPFSPDELELDPDQL
jgi:hypothetical protein